MNNHNSMVQNTKHVTQLYSRKTKAQGQNQRAETSPVQRASMWTLVFASASGLRSPCTGFILPFVEASGRNQIRSLCNITRFYWCLLPCLPDLFLSGCVCVTVCSRCHPATIHQCDFHVRGDGQVYEHTKYILHGNIVSIQEHHVSIFSHISTLGVLWMRGLISCITVLK